MNQLADDMAYENILSMILRFQLLDNIYFDTIKFFNIFSQPL